MIEIFKTNITRKSQTAKVKNIILKEYGKLKIDFDLEDIDNILRIEGALFEPEKIISQLEDCGFYCEVLT